MQNNRSISKLVHRRDVLATLSASVVSSSLTRQTYAQTLSDKPVRFVLPNAAGSGIDAIVRAAQPAFAKSLGHPVVVDNQPGAGGIVGLQALARAPADGMTLSVVSNNVVIFPSVLKNIPFDVPGDFTPIAVVGYTPIVLVVNPKLGVSNAREFIERLKGGKLAYASGGNGTILHLASEMLLDETKTKALHVPYKGVGAMLTDLIGGQVDFATAALPSVQQHLKSGALRAVGVATTQRTAAAPEIATFVEQGFPNYTVDGWFAVVGPKGLSSTDAKRLHAAVVSTFSDPEVKAAMARQGNVINVGSQEAAAPFFRSELAKFAEIVKKAGVQAQ